MKKDRKWRRSKIKSRCRAPAVLFNVDPTSLNQPITQRCLSAVLLYQLDTVVCLSFSSELLPPFCPLCPLPSFCGEAGAGGFKPPWRAAAPHSDVSIAFANFGLNSRRWYWSFITSLTFRRLVSVGFLDTPWWPMFFQCLALFPFVEVVLKQVNFCRDTRDIRIKGIMMGWRFGENELVVRMESLMAAIGHQWSLPKAPSSVEEIFN